MENAFMTDMHNFAYATLVPLYKTELIKVKGVINENFRICILSVIKFYFSYNFSEKLKYILPINYTMSFEKKLQTV